MNTATPLTRRIARTLFNPDAADRSLGLRGAAFLLIALISTTQWPWTWSQPTNWLLAAGTVLLFAIGGFFLQQAWRESDAEQED